MPELPEVETIKNYLHKNCLNLKVLKVSKFRENLRWAMPDVSSLISGRKIQDITRRAKYLIIKFDTGNLIMHFGMSGFLTIINEPYDTWLKSKKKHDHFAIAFENKVLVLNDARRFGAVLWHDAHNINNHELLKHLGPEPLSESFSPEYLHEILKGRKTPIKLAIMNSKLVVGVGNIYANEALFLSRINPNKPATDVSFEHLSLLVKNIKQILKLSIQMGGTTLKDYKQVDGKPGYFKQTLQVYGRGGDSCNECESTLQETRLGQRATVYCEVCQG
jgi:formamidopyrimidine-DNA glycosylase